MSLGWRHGLAMPFVAAAGAVRHMAAWGLPWRACPLGLSEIASRRNTPRVVTARYESVRHGTNRLDPETRGSGVVEHLHRQRTGVDLDLADVLGLAEDLAPMLAAVTLEELGALRSRLRRDPVVLEDPIGAERIMSIPQMCRAQPTLEHPGR
jgi:hypothetical protein